MLADFFKSVDLGSYYAFSEATRDFGELAQAMQLGTWVGSYVAVAVLACLTVLFLAAQQRIRAALIVLAVLLVACLAAEVVRHALPAARPENAARLVDPDEMQRSFPSREAFTFTLAAALLIGAAWGAVRHWAARLLVTTIAIVLILWVAMSQIMLGLHFVTDVAAGLFGGLALALLTTRLLPARAASITEKMKQET